MAETRHARQAPTPLQRSWARLVVAIAVSFATLLLPRAQATSWEAHLSTYLPGFQATGDAELPSENALFFAFPATIELLLLALSLLLGLAIRLRPECAPDLRAPAYVVALLLPGWVTLAVLIPGLGEAPFRILPGGWIAIAAAVVTGALLAVHATKAIRPPAADPTD